MVHDTLPWTPSPHRSSCPHTVTVVQSTLNPTVEAASGSLLTKWAQPSWSSFHLDYLGQRASLDSRRILQNLSKAPLDKFSLFNDIFVKRMRNESDIFSFFSYLLN